MCVLSLQSQDEVLPISTKCSLGLQCFVFGKEHSWDLIKINKQKHKQKIIFHRLGGFGGILVQNLTEIIFPKYIKKGVGEHNCNGKKTSAKLNIFQIHKINMLVPASPDVFYYFPNNSFGGQCHWEIFLQTQQQTALESLFNN